MSTENHSVFETDPSSPVHPMARAFLLRGGSVGVLLIHGYGGSIGDYRELADQLHRHGLTVAGLCLPGHGQTPEVLAEAHTTDWREAVFNAARELKRAAKKIILVGASFGGALAIDYAAHAPDQVAGVVTINTAMTYRGSGPFQGILLRLLRLRSPYHRKSSLSAADRQIMAEIGSLDRWPIEGILETQRFHQLFLRPDLPRLQTPLRVITTTHDPYVTQASAQQLIDLAGNVDKKLEVVDIQSHRPIRDPAGQARILKVIISLASNA